MGNAGSNEIEIFEEGELEAELERRGGAGEIGVKELVVKGYNDVIETVIRPPRVTYDMDDLGSIEFSIVSSDYASPSQTRYVRRQDFHLLNDRGLKLVCSHWQLFATAHATTPIVSPCLVYLHSNLGSRVDALRIRDLALQRGMSVFAFDFSGSGLSDGIYVTMGWNESKDLHFVLEHLEEEPSVEQICVYAHSMGTFPAIVNVACRSVLMEQALQDKFELLPTYFRSANANLMAKPIKGMVLDGAYASMTQLTEELMLAVQQEGFKVPLPVLKLACKVVRQSVRKRAEVDLDLLRPMDFVQACTIPACFVSGTDDRYVATQHSKALADHYAGPAITLEVDGDHYGLRTEEIYAQSIDFLYGSLRSASM